MSSEWYRIYWEKQFNFKQQNSALIFFNFLIKMFKVTFNKFHKNRNSDISLIMWVLYQLQILFWCPDNQNEFHKHKKWTTSLWRNRK
jgi:hypothetical protein